MQGKRIHLKRDYIFDRGEIKNNYPKYAGDKMGKFTQNVYGIKWVKLQGEERYCARDMRLQVVGMVRSGMLG